MFRGTVLIVEDAPQIRQALKERLERDGFQTQEASGSFNPDSVLGKFDAVVVGHDSTSPWAQAINAGACPVPVIALSSQSPAPSDDVALNHGEFGAFQAELNLEAVSQRLCAICEPEITPQENELLSRLIGDSAAMVRTKRELAALARNLPRTILVTGGPGTGKGLAAHLLHQLSTEPKGPMLSLACAGLPPEVIELELFGSTRHEGLFERAQGGILMLDDAHRLPASVLDRLLELLEHEQFRTSNSQEVRPVDLRVILVRPLWAGAMDGRRTPAATLTLPQLSERMEDLPQLVDAFVAEFAERFQKNVTGVHPSSLEKLASHGWPGGVRELRTCVERAVRLSPRAVLEPFDFAWSSARTAEEFELPFSGVDIEALERLLVAQALERSQGNRTRAASLLGMNRDQIRYRIEKFGLESKPRSDHR